MKGRIIFGLNHQLLTGQLFCVIFYLNPAYIEILFTDPLGTWMLSATIAAGVFSPGPKVERDLAFHYATLEDWQEFLERPRTGTVEAAPVKLESALLEVSRSDDVEVVVTEETGFSLFERNSSDCPA